MLLQICIFVFKKLKILRLIDLFLINFIFIINNLFKLNHK